ncbi:MAG: SDR family oxidoreductase [Elusimicrobia bacterium]|nr:SDR family oxidoreductase [Elusimicrobiota bacterium]
MPTPKVILITGCSSGFGLIAAVRLASKGHRVYATMRDTSKKDLLLVEAAKRNASENIRILPLDVTRPDTIRAAVQEIMAESNVIDVLINNAGFGMGGFFEDISAVDYRAQFDVNFFGVLNVTREVLPVMRPRRKGLIINISSMAAFSGTPCFSAYCASKWAIEGFSECLYMELRPFDIRVALVEPGPYRTRIFDENARYGLRFNDPESPYYEQSQRLKAFVDRRLHNQLRDPGEVARVIEHLVESRFPSFRNIVGWRARLRVWLTRIIPFKWYAWMVRQVFLRIK